MQSRSQLFTTTASLFLAASCLSVAGCKEKSPPAPTAATQPTARPEVAAPYKMPDKLPAPAHLALVKQENGASVYRATWDRRFEFDPAKAQLALEINTVGWRPHGRIVVTNEKDDDNAGSESHEQSYPTQPPTTQGLDLPVERQLIQPDESGWIKQGGITLLIRNEGADASEPAPTIVSVTLVPADSQ